MWLFSSGPTGEGDPVELLKGWTLPESLQPLVNAVQPHDTAVFHGAIDPADLGFMEKTAIKAVKAPTGDFRDWQAISDWATAVAQQLQQPA